LSGRARGVLQVFCLRGGGEIGFGGVMGEGGVLGGFGWVGGGGCVGGSWGGEGGMRWGGVLICFLLFSQRVDLGRGGVLGG